MAIADTTMERYGNDGEQALRGYPRDTDVCIGIPVSEMQQHDGTSKYHNLLEMNKVRFFGGARCLKFSCCVCGIPFFPVRCQVTRNLIRS